MSNSKVSTSSLMHHYYKGFTLSSQLSFVGRLEKLLGSRPLASSLTISGLLTLLSKCFSTFPQGTCSLSISRQYLAMDGGYHPVCALLPKSVTHAISTVQQVSTPKTGLSPSVAYLSRYLRRLTHLVKTMMYNSELDKPTPIHISGYSLFARRYSGNPSWFLFLRLIICLNSAGSLT
jgi:hypothetical protein